jgi:hypothetical protein
MFIKKEIFFILALFFIGFIVFADNERGENPDEISDYWKGVIESGALTPLPLLDTDKEKYGVIINIMNNRHPDERMFNYYYMIEVNPEHDGHNTEYIYHIFYYEYFFNKYQGYLGDPTNKCFSVIFDESNEFLEFYYWR